MEDEETDEVGREADEAVPVVDRAEESIRMDSRIELHREQRCSIKRRKEVRVRDRDQSPASTKLRSLVLRRPPLPLAKLGGRPLDQMMGRHKKRGLQSEESENSSTKRNTRSMISFS